MRTILGVDAGGSRTTAVVAEDAGPVLARGEAGPGAIRPGLVAEAAAAIATACRDAIQRARRAAPADVLCVGASGAGRPAERARLESALRDLHLADRVVITTDAEIAFEAAFGSGPGVVLIAGTGSVAWARLPDGFTVRAGGLGPVLGDPGSAHDIAMAGLRLAARAMDGAVDGAPLLARILAHLGLDAADLPAWSLGARVPDIVTLAPVVAEAARSGDAAARAILDRAARDLAATALLLLNRFPQGSLPALAWAGGLLMGSKDYRELVMKCVRDARPDVAIGADAVDGAVGAVAIGRRAG